MSARAAEGARAQWDLIRLADHEALCARLPPVDDDPAVAILRGRE